MTDSNLQNLLEAVACFGRTQFGEEIHEHECGVMKHALRNAEHLIMYGKRNEKDKWVMLFRKGRMMLEHDFKDVDFLPWLEKQLEIEKGKRAAKAEKKLNKKAPAPPAPAPTSSSGRPMRAAKADALEKMSKKREAAPDSTSAKRLAVTTSTKDSAAAAAAAAATEDEDDDDDEYFWITDDVVEAHKCANQFDISEMQRIIYLARWNVNMNLLVRMLEKFT